MNDKLYFIERRDSEKETGKKMIVQQDRITNTLIDEKQIDRDIFGRKIYAFH